MADIGSAGETAVAGAAGTAQPQTEVKAEVQAPATETKGALFGGKYKSQDEYDKAFKESASALGRAQQEAAELRKQLASLQPKTDSKMESVDAPVVKAPPQQTQQQDLIGQKITAEFKQNGKLSDETRRVAQEFLAKNGLPSELVGQIETQLANNRESLFKKAQEGVTVPVKDLMDYALDKYKDNEVMLMAFDVLGENGDFSFLKSLEASYQAQKKDSGVKLQTGTVAAAGYGTGYQDTAEIGTAFGDSRYGLDKEYTKNVQQRYAITRPEVIANFKAGSK